ncbi:MAG TPA: hypothetical protein VI299_29410, partial [Polyangiales bacterium]
SVVLDLLIYKADYWTADKSQIAPMTVTDDNFNEHYLEAETEIAISISIELSTSPEGEDVDVEIGDIELAPTELLRRALRGRSLDEFLDALRHAIAGEPVEDYVADTPIESEIQDVTVLEAYQAEAPHLREIVDTDGWRHVCAFDARASGDVEWVVTAPSPFDAESFASIALNEESGAPILQDHDSEVPLEVDATAAWDPEHGWHDFEVNSVRLDETEANERRSRPTRSEELLMDLADEQD